MTSVDTGYQGEDLACDFLKKQGYKILERNYRIRGGELDIIAREGGVLVFVEVKARYTDEYGLAVESITPWKIKALKKSALFYIQKINWGWSPYRFDLVTIDHDFGETKIEVVKNIIN